MREADFRTKTIKYTGLAATLLLLGLFFWWNLNQTVTAHAFSQTREDPAQGTSCFLDNETEGGVVVDSDMGVTLYYQIHGAKENGQVYISGCSYSSAVNNKDSVELILPAYIKHGDGNDKEDGTRNGDGTIYTVAGVNAGVFKNFTHLSGVTFPSTYEWIGPEAFYGCPLTSVTFNEGLKEIGSLAFYGCSQLTPAVTIPQSVNMIGTGAFANCTQLRSISVLAGNQRYCAEGGILYSRDKTQLIQCPAGLFEGGADGNNFYIGSETCPVTLIAARAFEGCRFLYQISGIHSTVGTIGERAFYGCTSLTRVKIPGTVQTIGEYAFSNCGSGLVFECHKSSAAENFANGYGIATSVTCTVNFYNGSKIEKTEEVQVGGSASAPYLAERAGYTLTWDKDYTNVQQNLNVYAQWMQNFTVTFKDSYSGQVMEIASYYGGSVTPPAWTREGYVLGWDTTAYTYVTKDLTVNAVWLVSMTGGTIAEENPQVGDTRTINNITYQVTRATISDPRVKAVGCTKQTLTTLVIPDTITFGGITYKVTNIGTRAFRDMPKLATLEIGKNVVKINRAAFYNCPKLKTITIHSKKLSSVAARAFGKTYVKAKVNVPNAYISKYKKLLLDGGLSTYATVY